MCPVLFEIFGAELHSYYLLWGFALLLLLLWTRRRAVHFYGMSNEVLTSVLLWVYCAGILGSFVPGILERLPLYLDGKIAFGGLFRGLYSAGGLLAGGLVGLYRLRKLGASVDAFADAAAIPLTAMLSVGRFGCLLAGCCSGIGRVFVDAPKYWLHFPYEAPNFFRFPSQPLESFAAALITLFLLFLSAMLPVERKKKGGLLFPFVLIFYGLYRLLSDPYRQLYADGLMNINRWVWASGIILGAAWLSRTVRKLGGKEL